ncbi:hypothetical protein [Corynebacterium rouxii]|uniref:Uncharacterized protein n=1 Tax=Corynebacterium rouxii TaxID=2719119 RepID=A0ABU3PNH4_9CORY|nr:hypothetical protein [Corynebacterium rouxii]MDT9409134.1 hypothetical protein [Corynebacterium rouxii]MDT9411367.1 hypothetical protein [Corynebacterium rouxii]
MPRIVFDCLIDEPAARHLIERIDALTALLVRDNVVRTAHVNHQPQSPQPDSVREELTATYLRDRGAETADELSDDVVALDALSLQRFTIVIDGLNGSLNETAMTYSRLLTPAARLSNNALELTDEQRYEVPAAYPWTVFVSA